MADQKFKVFCETRIRRFAIPSARIWEYREGSAEHGQFSDGETRYQILENVRGAHVFVVQPCANPVDLHLMQLLIMVDAFKRASAWRITPVIPYYPYSRQDRKDRPRVAISAKLVADLLETVGRAARFRWTCTRRRFRDISIFRWIICMPRRCWWNIFRRSSGPDDGAFARCRRR